MDKEIEGIYGLDFMEKPPISPKVGENDTFGEDKSPKGILKTGVGKIT